MLFYAFPVIEKIINKLIKMDNAGRGLTDVDNVADS